jgi:hypothetical protein
MPGGFNAAIMALAILTTVEKEIEGASGAYAKADAPKAMARELEKLDFAARCKNVSQFSSFLSESRAALEAQLRADGFDPSKMRLPPEQWYPAGDGLKTVRAVTAYVNEKLNDFKQPRPILKNLKAAEDLLAAAEAAGVKFHFTKADV